MKAHLQGDLDGRGAVARVEAVAEHAAGRQRKPLSEQHRRLVAEPRQQHVLEPAELVGQRGIDTGIAMPEQIDPPRADGVEIAPPGEVIEPAARAPLHRHERQRLVLLHLGAWMPHGGQAAL
jgi:hypothetical protein